MSEGRRVWQPGERAVYTDWAGRRVSEVTIVRYSRSKFGAHCVLVRDDGGKRFTIHERFLSPARAER